MERSDRYIGPGGPTATPNKRPHCYRPEPQGERPRARRGATTAADEARQRLQGITPIGRRAASHHDRRRGCSRTQDRIAHPVRSP